MAALADLSAVEARLPRPLLAAEYARCEEFLEDASAQVRAYTGQDFTRTDDATVVLRAQQGELRLPQRPVRAVTSVVAIGAGGAPDLPVVGWQWDGLDIVRAATDTPFINMPELWVDEDADAYPGTYRVTYSYGVTQVPRDVASVVVGMVIRTLTAPTTAGGMTGENLGPYSYRTDGSGAGAAVLMTDADRRVLDRYRRSAGMTMVRYR